MTRDEILNEIGFHGKYTKEVKRKLNKLLKKYHPDNNKDDQKTILILYEVKKELEEGNLNYTEKKEYKMDTDTKNHLAFLENMLEKFKLDRDSINKKINDLYKKINDVINDREKKQEELYEIEKDILNLEYEINNLLKIDTVDKLITLFILCSCVGSILLRNTSFLLLDAVLIVLEIYYIYIRYIDYKNKLNALKGIKRKYKSINSEYKDIEEMKEKLEKEEVKLKKERNKINNNIQYYSHQISLIKNNEYINTDEKEHTKRKK